MQKYVRRMSNDAKLRKEVIQMPQNSKGGFRQLLPDRSHMYPLLCTQLCIRQRCKEGTSLLRLQVMTDTSLTEQRYSISQKLHKLYWAFPKDMLTQMLFE